MKRYGAAFALFHGLRSLLACACLSLWLTFTLWGQSQAADPIQPVATDSRIKTFIYNENDVFALGTYYGYQCNIEFGLGEEIQTISVGDRTSWQIISAGRRLFIRPLETGLHTNMTVVTSKRAYQFDLSSGASESRPPRDLAYVVRFYYPQDDPALGVALIDSADLANASGSRNDGSAARARMNLNYTLTGPPSIAPLKVFDDGKSTYFKFASGGKPSSISLVRADGSEAPASASESDGYIVVGKVARQFTLRRGADTVSVYNEAP